MQLSATNNLVIQITAKPLTIEYVKIYYIPYYIERKVTDNISIFSNKFTQVSLKIVESDTIDSCY